MAPRWSRMRVLVLTTVLLVPLGVLLLRAPAAGSANVVLVLSGTTEVSRGSGPFTALADGEVVGPGDQLRTVGDGHSVVTFFDGSTIALEPGAVVRVDDTRSADGAVALRLFQSAGRTWSAIHAFADARSRYEVATPVATASVRGTGLIVTVAADGTTDVAVTDGSATVTAQGRDAVVGAGEQIKVSPGQPPGGTTSAAPQRILRFGLHSRAFLAVVDPRGRSCGIVLPGPAVVRQITGCLATPPGVEPQLIDIPDAVGGTYRMAIAPDGEGGPFTVSASALSGNALVFNLARTGSVRSGEVLQSSVTIAVGDDGVSSSGLSELESIGVTPVKARSPSPSASSALPSTGAPSTPEPELFRPLPTIGFEVGPTVTPARTLRSSTASPTPTRTDGGGGGGSATPSPAPTATPTRTPATPSTTATSSSTPTASAAPTPSPTPSVAPTSTASPTPSTSPSPTPSSTASQATATPSPTSTQTPGPTATLSPTPTPTSSATPTSTATETRTPTPAPTRT